MQNNQNSFPETDQVSCRHSVLKLLLARNCHSYSCRRYEFRPSLPELATRPQFRNADLRLAAPLPSYLTAKKVAFTLAEVLITLGIIGVVAALTIPNLVAKYQKFVLKNQFLKAYSNLQNAINMTISANGNYYDCFNLGAYNYNISECPAFWNDFQKNVKTLRTCEYQNGGCGVKYKTSQEVVASGGTTKNTSCSFFDIPLPITVNVLADGSFVIYPPGRGTHNTLYMGIDVNGKKGPNKWGYDVFYLMMQRENMSSTVKLSDPICALKEKGGYYATEMVSINKL